MRIALLALCVTLGFAADEEFTLKDGRVLVGRYDDKIEKLTAISGRNQMTFPLAATDIVSRKPATLSPAAAPKAEPPKKDTDEFAKIYALGDRVLSAKKVLKAAEESRTSAEQQYREALFGAVRQIIPRLRLQTLAPQQGHPRINDYNGLVLDIQKYRDLLAPQRALQGREESERFLSDRVVMLISYPDLYRQATGAQLPFSVDPSRLP